MKTGLELILTLASFCDDLHQRAIGVELHHFELRFRSAGLSQVTSDVHLFDPRPGTQWLNDTTLARQTGGAKYFAGRNPEQGTAISYYLKTAAAGDVTIAISDVTGRVVRTMQGTKTAGLNRVQWDLRGNPPQRPANHPEGVPAQFGRALRQGPPVEPGTYLVKLSVGGKDFTTKVVVEADDLRSPSPSRIDPAVGRFLEQPLLFQGIQDVGCVFAEKGPVLGDPNFGAFVEIAPAVEWLVHVSKITTDRRLSHPRQALSIGQSVEVTVLAVDPAQRRLSLSMVERAKAERKAAERAERDEEKRALDELNRPRSLGTFGDLLADAKKKK